MDGRNESECFENKPILENLTFGAHPGDGATLNTVWWKRHSYIQDDASS